MKAIKGNILFKIDVTQKEKLSFAGDKKLHIERNYNFNLREDRASMGYCIDGENIPARAKILVHHLSTEPNYEVPYAELFLTDEEIKEGYKIFAIPKDMCFCYHDGSEWIPCEKFLITKRIFKEYKGVLDGIPTEQVLKRLYVVKGFDDYEGEPADLSGKVMAVTLNSDYQIIFHDENNKEQSVIRTRWREIEAIDYQMTKDVEDGKYLVGIELKDAKPLNQNVPIS